MCRVQKMHLKRNSPSINAFGLVCFVQRPSYISQELETKVRTCKQPTLTVMEVQCSPLSWEFFYQEEGIEELKHSLSCTTLELETTILSAKEKISTREEEIARLKDLLSKALQERDEAEAKCQTLVLDKLKLQQELQKQQQQNEDNESNKHLASSDSEIIVPSPNADPIMMPPAPLSSPPPLPHAALKLGAEKPLPEKGRLLQAVIEAGPLLQTLLLAGPLPQWQHPPPQLKSIEIPPVAISPPPRRLLNQDSCISSSSASCFSNKRSLVSSDGSGSDSPPNTKHQKTVLH
ncbi:hypothetical protein TB1_001060 [Malus domestica]